MQNVFPNLANSNVKLMIIFLLALPHPEVPTAEFYKHISAQLTEPTRMRCLLGWCGSRALPPKPDAPKQSSKEANAEFQALQAGKIEEEFSTSRG
jgi:kinetochore protein Mis13/DSN1